MGHNLTSPTLERKPLPSEEETGTNVDKCDTPLREPGSTPPAGPDESSERSGKSEAGTSPTTTDEQLSESAAHAEAYAPANGGEDKHQKLKSLLEEYWLQTSIAAVGLIVACVGSMAAMAVVPDVRKALHLDPSPTPFVPIATILTATSPTPRLTLYATPTLVPTPSPTPYVIVSAETAAIYTGPGEVYDPCGGVHRYDELPLRGRSEDGAWLQIDYLGWQGWVRADSVAPNVDLLAIPTAEVPPTPVNRSPVIEGIDMASTTIEAHSIITVSCQASDQDKDRLTYTWTASGGSVVGEGDHIVYYAPQTLGSQTIHVTVRDEHEKEHQQDIQVQIIPVVAPEDTFEPAGAFGQLWGAGVHSDMRHKLSGATDKDGTTDGAQQFFDRGQMLWRKDIRKIYVLAQNGTWQRFSDTWEDGMDISSCPEATQQMPAPIRGFGVVWCKQLGGSNADIGWATTDEQPYNVHWQTFENGLMGQGLDGSLAGYIYVYEDDDSWQLYPPPTSEGPSSCPYAPQQRVQVADRARVCTGHERLGLHAQPQQHSPEVTSLESGTLFTVIDGPVCANGWSWWKIHTDSGTVGWVAEGGNDIGPYSICPSSLSERGLPSRHDWR